MRGVLDSGDPIPNSAFGVLVEHFGRLDGVKHQHGI